MPVRKSTKSFEKKNTLRRSSCFNAPPSSLSILLYKLNIRCGRGFRVAVEKEGMWSKRAHAQINSRKHEALPCRFACLLGGNSVFLCLSHEVSIALSPSPEKREQLYFSYTPALLWALSPSRSRHYGGLSLGEENSILSGGKKRKIKEERKVSGAK